MAPVSGKRKRVQIAGQKQANEATPPKKLKQTVEDQATKRTTVQIVTGDYERVLHGLAATLPQEKDAPVSWSETFLFSAHTASIRCLAVSPEAENGKRFLATGSADERINVYSISNAPPAAGSGPSQPTLNGTKIAENANNRSLGSLNHHDRAITRLHFPTKGKLFSAAEDNLISISRTRDWTMLSSIKAPIPKVQGRPSGDTAAPGEVPTGVNDFAIHPSQKLMLSVSRGERSMRLWNLMTGKKAGVLNFDRDLLAQVGETKFSSGEGRRVLWTGDGEQYLVGFERGAVVFGIDSKPRAILRPPAPTKLHEFRLVPLAHGDLNLLAVSTEDGRILFYDLATPDLGEAQKLPQLSCIAQAGGRGQGVSSRLKDFRILPLPDDSLLVLGAASDGIIWLWLIMPSDLIADTTQDKSPKAVGRLLDKHKTESRITCLDAFVMHGEPAHTNGHADSASDHENSASDSADE